MTEPKTNKVDTAKAVDPKGDSTKETTPIGDAVTKDLAAKAPESAEPVDETDVPAALQRKTDDGKGDEDPGPSDFRGFATEGVEEASP